MSSRNVTAKVTMTPEGRAYMERIHQLAKKEVAVGFFNDQTYPDGQRIVDVAARNEMGDSRVPARPFMKQMGTKYEDRIYAASKDSIVRLSEGGSTQAALESLGELLEGMVKDEITFGQFAANSPATIAQKGSSHPLIDTGLMRQSVKSKVRNKT